MDQLIRHFGVGVPVTGLVVLAIAYLAGLLIVRLTNPLWISARSQARTLERLLDMVDEIEDNGARSQNKDAEVIALTKMTIRGAFGMADDHEDNASPPDDGVMWRTAPADRNSPVTGNALHQLHKFDARDRTA